MYKIILGIETSCDETAVAVLQKDESGIKVLSNVVASSSELQATFGGVIPEQAAREQLKAIIPVIETAIKDSGLTIKEVDAIAVTYGPGLIGSLLIGVETAKTLAQVWEKPLIPVNHLIGHFYANWISQGHESRIKNQGGKDEQTLNTLPLSPRPNFPCIGLLVSGGHSDLVLFTDHGKYEYLGGTRDDAAGECFDKSARLMGLPYPGGPQISKLAKLGDASKIKLPKPMMDSHDFDFSFSGLKTAVSNLISEELKRTQKTSESENLKSGNSRRSGNPGLSESFRNNLAASLEQTIIEVLARKTEMAVKKFGVFEVIVAGGVAANENLSARLRRLPHVMVRNPQKIFCTDNGAMIAAAGFFTKETINPLKLQADPNLTL